MRANNRIRHCVAALGRWERLAGIGARLAQLGTAELAVEADFDTSAWLSTGSMDDSNCHGIVNIAIATEIATSGTVG
ncbi:hypothetical protein ACQPXH_14695 [Nocardia sp. CA-135953]|uniref:hypothetical protein n=1 Tax=Nocardia sp. CA-135953 TaxID=3239978 RepID=UPI003D97A51F